MNTAERANRGRPLAFDPEQALQQAMLLFWRHGYEGTSTADLMKAMGLSKSSLYQTFGSKQALFNQCLDAYGQMTLGQMQQAFEVAESPKRFLLELIYATATYTPPANNPRGCFIVNSACEMGAQSDIAGPLVRQRSEKVLALLQRAAQAMADKGELPEGSTVDSIAHQLLTCVCGLKVVEKLDYSQEERLATYRMVEKLLS